MMRRGWYGESRRHYLAAKGVKTKVDVKQIKGRWQQERVKPKTPPFQKGCKEVQAEYKLLPDGNVQVTNFCKDGKVTRKIVGKGYRTEAPNKLKVDFFPGIPFTQGDFEVTKYDGDTMTVEGGGYQWELKRVKDKKAFLKHKAVDVDEKVYTREEMITFIVNEKNVSRKEAEEILMSESFDTPEEAIRFGRDKKPRSYNYTPTYVAADLPLIAADGVGTAGAAAVPLIPVAVAAGALFIGAKVIKKQVDKNKKKTYKMVKRDDPRYEEWRELVNMSPAELKAFKESELGKEAGLSRKEAREEGIRSGQDSAEAILRMRKKRPEQWTDAEEKWMERQNAFVNRMRGVKGPLYKDGKPTRKHTALKIWGHDPEKKKPWNGNRYHPEVS